MWLFKAAWHSLCIEPGIQRIVFNTDKYEWPQMLLATDVRTVVQTSSQTMNMFGRFMVV